MQELVERIFLLDHCKSFHKIVLDALFLVMRRYDAHVVLLPELDVISQCIKGVLSDGKKVFTKLFTHLGRDGILEDMQVSLEHTAFLFHAGTSSLCLSQLQLELLELGLCTAKCCDFVVVVHLLYLIVLELLLVGFHLGGRCAHLITKSCTYL